MQNEFEMVSRCKIVNQPTMMPRLAAAIGSGSPPAAALGKSEASHGFCGKTPFVMMGSASSKVLCN
jgi:hypothetical protein